MTAAPSPDPDYLPLSRYGLIGDCRTAALISDRGSIDWLCAPDFDSPSLFARLLDARRGGHFTIRPTARFDSTAAYAGHSGVLETAFRTASGTARLTDFMPLTQGEPPQRFSLPRSRRRLVRIVEGIKGEVELEVDFAPRPDYATRAGQARALRRTVRAGERFALALQLDEEAQLHEHPQAGADLDATLRFWRRWHEGCRYRGAYFDAVMRSAAALKLLVHAPTGAMVAAPTTSLPEEIGGVRNWDYRYTWIRDAAFGFHALFHAGHPEDAQRFMRWTCETALRCEPGALQIMYGLRGERELPERTLAHLEGYRGSRPVRVGNQASTQFQLDVYGELLDAFEMFRNCTALPEAQAAELWPAFRGQVDAVAKSWRKPDSGIWEVRSAPRHFVYSKTMAWVALDRGVRAAEAAGLPADIALWRTERAAVKEQVLKDGYDQKRGTFVQYYGAQLPDAANLLMPMVNFIDAADPRMRSTIDVTLRELVADGMVYRYRGADDGLPGGEATFATCTFWLVENLALAGRREEAVSLFERMLARATPLGLYAEQIEPRSGAHLGNFPQALSHLALINAALTLEKTK